MDPSPAPLLVRLELRAVGDAAFATNAARSVHGAIYQMLVGRDATLAARIHGSQNPPL
nr:hypothetical protein [Chloroflexia bacterium]